MIIARRRLLRLFIGLRSFSSSPAFRCFVAPPPIPQRRVVVTGLGMVTPLGCGVGTSWRRLINGECGIRVLSPEDLKMGSFDQETLSQTFQQLTSKVAAIVPSGSADGEFDEELWIRSRDQRSIARFIAYALCCADEALKDANWLPEEQKEKQRTVGVLEASVIFLTQQS